MGVGGRSCWGHSVESLKEKVLHEYVWCFSMGGWEDQETRFPESSQWLQHQE